MVELQFGVFSFFCVIHDDCCCVAFVRLKAKLFFNYFRAVTSMGYKVFSGLDTVISAGCVMTFSK